MINKFSVKQMAEWLHDNYEKSSKMAGWKTQKKCQVKFKDLPKENKEVMMMLASRVITQIDIVERNVFERCIENLKILCKTETGGEKNGT